MRLVTAPTERDWMDRAQRWPYRCLPMVMANQAGWFVLNSHAVFIRWDGGNEPDRVKFVYPDGGPPFPVESNFGYGIITWKIPFLFRTPPGYNLLVRGPANLPKDGVSALEGLVETDWAAQTFTMNWKLTRPNTMVSFGVGEPICMILPQRRSELESFEPDLSDLANEPELLEQHTEFARSRRAFIADHHWEDRAPGPGTDWQKHYYRGLLLDGKTGVEHQTKLRLRPFEQT